MSHANRTARFWGSAAAAVLLVAGLAGANPPAGPGYHVLKVITVGGPQGWDYLTMDSAARRLYIGRGNQIQVVDPDTGKLVGTVPGLQDAHGLDPIPALGRGYTSNGGTSTSTIVDLKTLKKIGDVKVGKGPDSFVYDDATRRVFTINVDDETATAIDAAKGVAVGSFALKGRPEFAVSDGKGHVYVNLTDKNQVVEFDAKALNELHRWSLSPCEYPSGLSMDRKNRRLFSVCDNEMMAVMDADTGKVVATPPIGQGVDASVFDPDTQNAFASNGEGTLTVVHEDSPNKFTTVETVKTRFGARTATLDAKTHDILVVTGHRGHGPDAPMAEGNSFVVLVVGK